MGARHPHPHPHHHPRTLTLTLTLQARHPRELHRSGARLPSSFRLPSSLEVEGNDRLVPLHTYLNRLMAEEALRRSEALVFFLAARTPARRRLWESAVGGTRRAGRGLV